MTVDEVINLIKHGKLREAHDAIGAMIGSGSVSTQDSGGNTRPPPPPVLPKPEQ